MQFDPIYTTLDNVKVRLANKVQFQRDPSTVQEGELPDALLGQLIVDAETEVEQDMRSRYAIPFQSSRTGRYADLPDHSQRALRVAVDLRAVIMILETDFGRGTHVNADGYVNSDQKHYDSYVNRLLGRDPEGKNDKHDRYRFSPPLEGVLLAASNKEADDGYKGRIINTDASRNDAVSYAERQLNNPARSYQNARRDRGRF